MIFRILNWIEKIKLEPFFDKYDQIMISAKKGRGKTSVKTVLEIFYSHIKKYYNKTVEDTKNLNKLGYGLIIPETNVFNDTYTKLSYKRERFKDSYFIQGSEFAMPNEDFDIAYIPAGSLISLDEGTRDLSSHDKDISQPAERAFQLARHNDYKVITCQQREGDIVARVKELADIYIYLRRKPKVYKLFDKIYLTTWDAVLYSELSDCLARRKPYSKLAKGVRSVLEFIFGSKDEIVDRVIEYKKFRFWGNIFEHYDSQFFRRAWLKGLKERGYTLKKARFKGFTPEEVERYNTMIYTVKPKDKSRGKPKEKKEPKEKKKEYKR